MRSGAAAFNPGVHGARGVFSAMVFVYHVYNSGLSGLSAVRGTTYETIFLDSMKFGVELFFGISGLVMVGALHRSPSTGAFVWDRVTRILPTLWVTLLTITAMVLVAGRALPSPGDWLANFLAPPPMFDVPMLHPAAWSLGYEFTFYGLCALAWAMRRAGVRRWLWLASALGAVLIVLYPRAILMAFGVIIAAALPLPKWAERLARHPFAMLALYLVAWRLIDMAADNRIRLASPLHMDLMTWAALAPLILGAGVIGGIVLLGIARGHGLFGRFLRLSTVQWLGTISYSFYLWHPICMAAVKHALLVSGAAEALGDGARIAFALLALPPSLFISHWSQRLLEDRLTRRLRRFGPDHRRTAGEPAAALPQKAGP